MLYYVTHHQTKKALNNIKNDQGLTPMTLSAKLGRRDLFEKMLEFTSIVSKEKASLVSFLFYAEISNHQNKYNKRSFGATVTLNVQLIVFDHKRPLWSKTFAKKLHCVFKT